MTYLFYFSNLNVPVRVDLTWTSSYYGEPPESTEFNAICDQWKTTKGTYLTDSGAMLNLDTLVAITPDK
jgi:hypothetical protein